MEPSTARQNNEMDSDNSILQRIMHLKELKVIGTRQIKWSCKATDKMKIWNTDNTIHIDCHRLLLFDEDEYFLCLVKILLGEEWSDVNQECWLRSSRESLSSELRFRHSFIRALAAETSILRFLCNVKWSLWRQVLREDSALPSKFSSEIVFSCRNISPTEQFFLNLNSPRTISLMLENGRSPWSITNRITPRLQTVAPSAVYSPRSSHSGGA